MSSPPPAACGLRTLCMTRVNGQYGAPDNACPHQGGPLGEGAIENGLLRCPWHGWDYDPLTGLWDANVDRAPVIALTGQVETQVLGPGAFQEIDLSAAFGKVISVSGDVGLGQYLAALTTR